MRRILFSPVIIFWTNVLELWFILLQTRRLCKFVKILSEDFPFENAFWVIYGPCESCRLMQSDQAKMFRLVRLPCDLWLAIFGRKMDSYVDFQVLYPPQDRPKCGQCSADGVEFIFLILHFKNVHNWLWNSSLSPTLFCGECNIFQPFHIKSLTSHIHHLQKVAIVIFLCVFCARTSFILLPIRSFFLSICSCVCIKIQAVSPAHFSFRPNISSSAWIDNTCLNPRTSPHTVLIVTITPLAWRLASHFNFCPIRPNNRFLFKQAGRRSVLQTRALLHCSGNVSSQSSTDLIIQESCNHTYCMSVNCWLTKSEFTRIFFADGSKILLGAVSAVICQPCFLCFCLLFLLGRYNSLTLWFRMIKWE